VVITERVMRVTHHRNDHHQAQQIGTRPLRDRCATPRLGQDADDPSAARLCAKSFDPVGTVRYVALSADDIALLDARARAVGEQIRWEMHFQLAPNPEFVGLTAGANHIVIVGPARIADLAAHDIDLTLDGLERGERRIIEDEDGDPRLV
jgi:hypothetical protein